MTCRFKVLLKYWFRFDISSELDYSLDKSFCQHYSVPFVSLLYYKGAPNVTASWLNWRGEKQRYAGTSESDSVGCFVEKRIRAPLGLCLAHGTALGCLTLKGRNHGDSSLTPE